MCKHTLLPRSILFRSLNSLRIAANPWYSTSVTHGGNDTKSSSSSSTSPFPPTPSSSLTSPADITSPQKASIKALVEDYQKAQSGGWGRRALLKPSLFRGQPPTVFFTQHPEKHFPSGNSTTLSNSHYRCVKV